MVVLIYKKLRVNQGLGFEYRLMSKEYRENHVANLRSWALITFFLLNVIIPFALLVRLERFQPAWYWLRQTGFPTRHGSETKSEQQPWNPSFFRHGKRVLSRTDSSVQAYHRSNSFKPFKSSLL